jgi:polyisoprenoid-binding protein YceI
MTSLTQLQLPRKIALCIVYLLMLISCARPEKQPKVVIPAAVVTAPSVVAEAQHYRISPEQSTLHILVYRGGTMAQLGHNHVISSANISGEVWLHESLEKSGFTIEFPVNELIVDEVQARVAEGSDFEKPVNDDAGAGTKRNMLKPESLDGERYPTITLRSVNITGTREQPQVTAQITIKDQSREVTLPVELTVTPESLRATGEFTIRQTDFGIKPLSIMMGAIQVQDQLTIRFELVGTMDQVVK